MTARSCLILVCVSNGKAVTDGKSLSRISYTPGSGNFDKPCIPVSFSVEIPPEFLRDASCQLVAGFMEFNKFHNISISLQK